MGSIEFQNFEAGNPSGLANSRLLYPRGQNWFLARAPLFAH